jgi:glycerol-3-phosphate dehydrogenase
VFLFEGGAHMYDVVIIGAGINGGLLAQRLSKYDLRVALLEKDNDVANEATAANSAIIHSGHDPKTGTLKAKLNIRGNALWEDLCKELKVDFIRNGAFVVAVNEEERIKLKELYHQAQERGVPSRLINRDEAIALEPNLSDAVVEALDLPSTGIVSPWEVTIAAIEDAMNHGLHLFLSHKVVSIDKKEGYFDITTPKAVFQSKIIINAAGVYSDEIYAMVSKQTHYKITPRRGEYYVLDRAVKPVVSRTIYPLPSEKGKGVLVVPTIHDNILIGPNSDIISDKEGKDNTAEALAYVKEQVAKTVKNIPMHTIIRTYVGLRPSHLDYDFVIEESHDVKNFINLIGVDSPGLASAPAIAEYVQNILSDMVPLRPKTEPRTPRRPWIILNRMNVDEKQAMFEKDAKFGQMVCRCELVSEGEIIDVIHRNAGARTVKAVKRRVRAGAGRCQGGFCEPRVIAILARELRIKPTQVLLDSDESTILVGETKENLA